MSCFRVFEKGIPVLFAVVLLFSLSSCRTHSYIAYENFLRSSYDEVNKLLDEPLEKPLKLENFPLYFLSRLKIFKEKKLEVVGYGKSTAHTKVTINLPAGSSRRQLLYEVYRQTEVDIDFYEPYPGRVLIRLRSREVRSYQERGP